MTSDFSKAIAAVHEIVADTRSVRDIQEIEKVIRQHLPVIEQHDKLHLSYSMLRIMLVEVCKAWLKNPKREDIPKIATLTGELRHL